MPVRTDLLRAGDGQEMEQLAEKRGSPCLLPIDRLPTDATLNDRPPPVGQRRPAIRHARTPTSTVDSSARPCGTMARSRSIAFRHIRFFRIVDRGLCDSRWEK